MTISFERVPDSTDVKITHHSGASFVEDYQHVKYSAEAIVKFCERIGEEVRNKAEAALHEEVAAQDPTTPNPDPTPDAVAPPQDESAS